MKQLQRRRYYLTQQASDYLDALAKYNNTSPSQVLEQLLLVTEHQQGLVVLDASLITNKQEEQ